MSQKNSLLASILAAATFGPLKTSASGGIDEPSSATAKQVHCQNTKTQGIEVFYAPQ